MNLTPQELNFCTSWVKMSDREILFQYMVDFEKATAEFRAASEIKHTTSSHIEQFL